MSNEYLEFPYTRVTKLRTNNDNWLRRNRIFFRSFCTCFFWTLLGKSKNRLSEVSTTCDCPSETNRDCKDRRSTLYGRISRYEHYIYKKKRISLKTNTFISLRSGSRKNTWKKQKQNNIFLALVYGTVANIRNWRARASLFLKQTSENKSFRKYMYYFHAKVKHEIGHFFFFFHIPSKRMNRRISPVLIFLDDISQGRKKRGFLYSPVLH